VTECSLVEIYGDIWEERVVPILLCLLITYLILDPEDRSSISLRNIGKLLQEYMALYAKINIRHGIYCIWEEKILNLTAAIISRNKYYICI
jgi:hypothetical protein